MDLLQKYWLLIFFVLLIIFLFKFFLKPKSKIKRVENDLKLYYDPDFKECVEILSRRLSSHEFEKVCMFLCNLREGYDYGFYDSINYAFYREIKKIRRKTNKRNLVKIIKLK